MSKRKRLPASPRHIMIYDEDWEFLTNHFGRHTSRPLGAGPVVCEIIHSRVKALKQKLIEALEETPPGEDSRNAQIMASGPSMEDPQT